MEDKSSRISENNNVVNGPVVPEEETIMLMPQQSKPSESHVVEVKEATKKVELRREIGLYSAVSLIVSVMIGSGIFVSPFRVLEMSGSVGLCLIVWALCGFVSYLGALSFGELGTVVGESGAEYAFFQASFAQVCNRFLGPLPGFVYIWLMVLIVRPAEVAVLVLTFSEYIFVPLVHLLGTHLSKEQETWIMKLIGVAGLGLITYINFRSVKLYIIVQNIFSSLKVVACFIIIIGGIYYMSAGHTEHIGRGFEGTRTSPKDMALAFYSGLWAYDGWTSVTVVAEEIKNPQVNIPRSISIGVPMVTCLYVMMNVAYMTVLSVPEIINSSAVAIVYSEKLLGGASFLIPLAVVLSTFGCALSVQFGVSRLCFVAGRKGHMIEVLSYIHVKRLTPAPAVLLQGFISSIFILSGSIIKLIEFVSFLIWIFYGLAMVSLIIMRKTKKDVRRPYKVPLVIPVFVALVSIYLTLVPLVFSRDPLFLIGVGFILLGVAVYYPLVYKKKHPPFMKKLTHMIQLLLKVVPPEGSKGEQETGFTPEQDKQSQSENKAAHINGTISVKENNQPST